MNDLTAQLVCRQTYLFNGLDVSMINDIERNQFYDKLISQVVKDKVCADIGFGSGLLTMMAIQHGAKHVYAYEMDIATFTMGKAMIEKMGYGDKVTFINKQYNYDLAKNDEINSDKIDIILHELLMRAIWGEGLYHIYKMNRNTKAQIHPSIMKCEIAICENIDYSFFGEGQSYDFDVGIDYLKDFNDTWHDLISSDKYFSFFPYKSTIAKMNVRKHFTNIVGEYCFDLNQDDIPEIIEVPIDLPRNCLVTTLCSIDGFYLLRNESAWSPDKTTLNIEKGKKLFKHNTVDGNWWLDD